MSLSELSGAELEHAWLVLRAAAERFDMIADEEGWPTPFAPVRYLILAELVHATDHGFSARRIARRLSLPPSTLARSKQGFGVPLARWFRAGLQRTLEEVLLDPRALARGVTREAGVRALLDEHARGVDHEARLYALVMLELWFRQWIDPPPGGLVARPVVA